MREPTERAREAARKALAQFDEDYDAAEPLNRPLEEDYIALALDDFARAEREREREECAKVCDRLIPRYGKAGPTLHEQYGAYTHAAHRGAVRACAAAIRARGEERA